MVTAQDVVVSGMRPTGRLHIGNYWGALKNWVSLAGRHQCYFFVADWHMLTTGYEDTSRIKEDTREMVLDWLAAGLDPDKCVLFQQSHVPEHAELALMLAMVTPLSWLENNPTWKEQLQELAKTKETKVREEIAALAGKMSKELIRDVKLGAEPSVSAVKESMRTFGFLGYPVLQAADVLMYHGTKVPVGQDQLPHLELSREIARRFNSIYGAVLTEPQPLLTPTPKVPGTDGKKMSKSYGNTVDLFETAGSLDKKVMSMYTDPNKIKINDPGNPEPCDKNPPGCTVYALHKLYGTHEFAAVRGAECRAGVVGCVACKKDLLGELEAPFSDFRAKREKYAKDPKLVDHVLEEGGRKARLVAHKTMESVRRAMRLA